MKNNNLHLNKLVTYLFFVTVALIPLLYIFDEQISSAIGTTKDILLAETVFVLTVIWLSAFGPSITKQNSKLEEINNLLRKENLSKIEYFEGEKKIFINIAKNIMGAQDRISIISWSSIGHPKEESEYTRRMYEAFNIISKSKNISFTRFLWNRSHLDILPAFIEKTDKGNMLEVIFLFPDEDRKVPITPCIIIDKKILHWGIGYMEGTARTRGDFVSRDETLIDTHTKYFEMLASDKAIILKERGAVLNTKKLKILKEALDSNDSFEKFREEEKNL